MPFSKPPSDKAKQKALTLFEESTTKFDSGDEPEYVDAFIAFEIERLGEFRRFVRDYNLPKADFMTWMSLYAKDWQHVDGDYLSAVEIAEFARRREPPTS